MKFPNFLTKLSLLWYTLGLSPLGAEVLVRISDQEQAHQIVDLGQQAWLAMESGAYRVDGNQLIAVLPDLPVTTIAEVEGQAWLGTSKGIYRVGVDGKAVPIFEDLVGERVLDIEEVDGAIWVGSSSHLTLIKGATGESKLPGYVHDISQIDDTIWVGTKRNAYRIDSSESPSQIFEEPVEVVRIVKAGDYVWMLTASGKQFYGPCFRIDTSAGKYSPEKYFEGEEVLTIAEVHNEIWFGTTRGLFRTTWDAASFPRQDLPNRRVHSIKVVGDKVVGDQVWVGTSQQAYRVTDEGYEPIPRTSDDINVHDFVPAGGRLWFVAHDGAYRLDEDVEIRFKTNIHPLLNTNVLLGGSARVLEARYDRDGRNPYGEFLPGDFEAILEENLVLFEKSLEQRDFVPAEKLERSVDYGFQEWHLIVRDNFGNATGHDILRVYVFDFKDFLALLSLFITALLIVLNLKMRFPRLFLLRRRHEALAKGDLGTIAHFEADAKHESEEAEGDEDTVTTHNIRPKVAETSLIVGRYARHRILGKGGMGYVFKARDVVLQRSVALKFLHVSAGGGDHEKRFRKEAEMMARLNHANIATVYDVGRHGGEFFIVMEYIEGRTLEDFLKGDLERCMSDMQEIFIQIGRGLDHAHSEGIVHRDVKPQNVMVRRDGVVKLMDFGVAKLVSGFSQTQGILGTPVYMAPEQITGNLITHKADLYALGVMLYQIATGGRLPFTGEDPMRERLQRPPDPPARINPEIVPAFQALILRCLEMEPARRPQDAMAFVRELENIDPLFHK